MKIYQKIIIVFVILNVTALGTVSYFLINDFQKSLTEDVIEDINQEIKVKSKIFENYLISNSDKTRLYTILPEIQGLAKFSEFGDSFIFDKGEWFELIKTQFKKIVNTNNDIDQIRVLDQNGMELIRINSVGNNLYIVSESDLQNKSDSYYFNDIITSSEDKVYISNIDLNEENGKIESPHKITLRFATPIISGDGSRMGIIIVNHKMENILSSIAQISKGDITIVDYNGQVIYSKDSSNLFGNQLQTGYNYFNENDSIFELLDNESMLYDNKNGIYKFWQKVPNPSDPEKYWIIIASIPQNVIDSPIQESIVNSYYFIFVFIIITIVITVILSKPISKNLDAIIKAITQAERGDYDSKISIKGSYQIENVGKSFNNLVSTLKILRQKSDNLVSDLNKQLSEVQFISKALDSSTYLMKVDLNGNMTYVNEKFCKLSGYDKSELLGQNPRILKSGIHSQEFYKDLWDTILDGKVWVGDTKNKRKDSTFYWTKKIIIPKKDSNGNIVEFLAIQTDITTDKEHEIHATTALQQEKQKRSLENEFTKMVSHNLKDPIHKINQYCEILKNIPIGENLSEEQNKTINELDEDAKKLEIQIDELLYIYKLHAHEITFKKSIFTAYLLIQKIILNHSDKTKERKITIINNIDPLLKINSDELYLTQVIDYLVQNALGFVPNDGGVIKVGAKIQEKNVIFHVQDNGTGFSPEEQNNLLKKYYDIDTLDKTTHTPFETRLILCKAIIEELGGKMWVESHLGFGSTFYFQLSF